MKLIKQSFEILEQEIPAHKLDDYTSSYFKKQYIENMLKHIERCGRICYKSTDKITENSSKTFYKGLVKSSHYSVLEHGVIYLLISYSEEGECYDSEEKDWIINRYKNNQYSKVKSYYSNSGNTHNYAITTTLRIIKENNWIKDLQYLCEPTEFHELRHTVLLHTCIHVYKDLTRHRKASFSIESTRYCNYSKTDKFGEMKFVLPSWLNEENLNNYGKYHVVDRSHNPESIFIANLNQVEQDYNDLIHLGWKPQQAAEVLPQCTAADVVMSGYDSDWDFIFSLRAKETTGKVHPLVLEIMKPLHEEFINKSWILPF